MMYPAALRGTGREGQVRLDARIGTDGFVADMRIIAASHPDFAEAVQEGLRQAQWEPARYRGILVEVPLELTVTFATRVNGWRTAP